MYRAFQQTAHAQSVLRFRCPRYSELPSVNLYVDQVVRLITDILAPLETGDDEKIITRAMINNYVKQHVIEPPQKKQYTPQQVAYLLVVCLLKRVLSISEITALLEASQTYPFETAYDYFCNEVENALHYVFGREGEMPTIYTHRTIYTDLVRSMVMAVAHKIYIQHVLHFDMPQVPVPSSFAPAGEE